MNPGVSRSAVSWRCAALILIFSLAFPAGASAQDVAWLLPSRELLPSLLAGPRNPLSHSKVLITIESANQLEPGFEGEVSLGASVPALLLAGQNVRDALVLGVEGAVYGRFTLSYRERDLISTDWVFQVPLVLHRGDHWVRLAYRHLSSHLGDDYGTRFDATPIDYGRDALDMLGYARLSPDLSVYGGTSFAYNVHPEGSARWELRIGAEAQSSARDSRFEPYGALDVRFDENASWIPRLNIQGGIWLPPIDGRRTIRFAVEFLTGPSPQGQFYDRQATQWAIGVWVNP